MDPGCNRHVLPVQHGCPGFSAQASGYNPTLTSGRNWRTSVPDVGLKMITGNASIRSRVSWNSASVCLYRPMAVQSGVMAAGSFGSYGLNYHQVLFVDFHYFGHRTAEPLWLTLHSGSPRLSRVGRRLRRTRPHRRTAHIRPSPCREVSSPREGPQSRERSTRNRGRRRCSRQWRGRLRAFGLPVKLPEPWCSSTRWRAGWRRACSSSTSHSDPFLRQGLKRMRGLCAR